MQITTQKKWIIPAIIFAVCLKSNAQFAGGTGSASDPYQIATLTQLQEVKNHVTSSFVLLNDIDASETSAWNSGSGFEPIGNSSAFFTGNFNGAGFKITGLTINRPSLNSVGLFGLQYSGVVSNLILENVNIIGRERVGALIGNKNGDAVNCRTSGSVTGTRNVGGLSGSNFGSITNSSSSCNVSGTSDVGGLIGSGAGTGVDNCFATGNVSGAGTSMGGFIGGISQNGGSIQNSYATGNVSTTLSLSTIGGFIGRLQAGTLTNCYATGNVSGGSTAGGFIGHNQSTIGKSYSTGTVSIGAGGVVGGFAGSNERGNISNCYSTSNVHKSSPGNSTGSAGGFVGRNHNGSTITNTYAAGTLTADGPVGAFAGTNEIQNADSGKIINSYWDTDVNTQATAVPNNQANAVNTQASGLSATQIRQLASFPGWDFASVWMIEEGVTRPLLRTTALSTSLQIPVSELRNKLKASYIKASQTIRIDDAEVERGAQLRVISVDGRVALIQSVLHSDVDVSALNAGVYIIELNTGRGIVKAAKILII
jgi:hypothetical protein